MEDYSVHFSRLAILDLQQVCDWYEAQSPGLSGRFVDALQEVVDKVSANPHQFMEKAPACRMARIKKFPYKVFFMVDERKKRCRVIAVIHRARHPQSWEKRL
jgi:plasmid stabilization system protein ParE